MMRPVLVLLFAFVLAACGGGSSHELKEPYGPPQELRMDTEAGPLMAIVSPWQEAEARQTPESLLTQERKRPVAKHKITRTAEAPSKTRYKGDIWVITRKLKPRNQAAYASTLYACRYKSTGEFIRLVDIYGPEAALKNEAARSEIEATLTKACKSRPSNARKAAIETAIRTRPGKGNANGKISRVLYATGTKRNGDFVGIKDNIYVLFKDKSAYRNPYVSLDDMDIKRSRALEPDRWTRWRKRGKSYELQHVNKDGSKEWRKISGSVYPVKKLKNRKKVDGKFEFVSTSGSMMFGSSSSWYYWTFKKDGTYSSSTSSFGGSGTMAFLDGAVPSYVHASSCNEKGGSSTFSSTSAVLVYGKTTPKKGCGDGKAGDYRIDGYTIELVANDGSVVRRPFYMHGKGKVIIGSRGYWRKKDEG